jgi:hypothetical protein
MMSSADFVSAHRRIDLSSVARTLLIGETLNECRARTYGRLLDREVVPPLAVRPTDTTGGYLARVFEALGERYAHVPFALEIAPFQVIDDELHDASDPDALEALARTNPVCVIVRVIDAVYNVDAERFDEELARCNAPLAAWLIEHVRRGTVGTFDAFTAASAYEYAEWGLLEGAADDWWEARRYDVAEELHLKPKAVTWAQMRKHVRDNELRTPGAIRRGLGRHHILRRPARLSLAHCAPLVAALPGAIRERAQVVLDNAGVLEAVHARMDRRIRRRERALVGAFGAPAANPGLILDTSRDGLVTELLNDEYEFAVQDTGFGPNYALVLDGTTGSAERFRATLDDLATATRAVDAIATAMTFGDPAEERSVH